MRLLVLAGLSLALAGCGQKAPDAPAAPEPLTQFNSPLLGQEAPQLEQAAGLGAAIEPAEVRVDGFAPDGYYVDAGAPPGGGGLGSYAPAGDAGQGSVTYTLNIPAGATALAIPVVTGPSGTNASFRVQSPDGTVLATLQDAPGLGAWRLWRVAVPNGVTSVQIVAADAGAGWGEWVAIGKPHVAK
jgi:hypothetical protein